MSRAPRSPNARRDWGSDDSATPILHVDMDAFFAAVELIDRPDLRGKPVIVGGERRGVVLAATYEARAFGVHSAMPIAHARALAPQAIFLPPHHDKYRRVSVQAMQILRSITPVVEPLSIDEAFLDVRGARRRLGSPLKIAGLIRERISTELGVVASVGIGATKFIAKLASQHAKPDGVLLIPESATIEFLHGLPVGVIWGVGEKTEQKLADRAIRTVADIAHTPLPALEAFLGKTSAVRLHELAWGRDPRAVEVQRQEKSIGHEITFHTDLTDRQELRAVLLDHAHRCAARLRSAGLLGAVVAIKVRFSDFSTINRSVTLANPTDVAHEIYQAGADLLEAVTIPRGGVRLLGIRCENLSDAATTAIQPLLGDDGTSRREAERAMDEIKAKFGSSTVRAGSLIESPATRNRGRGLS